MTTLRHSTTCDYLVRHRQCDCRLSTINSQCQQGQHANCGGSATNDHAAACSCDCHPGEQQARQSSLLSQSA